jgi:hypothetical protein
VAAFTVTRTAVTTATCRLQASRISIELLPKVHIHLSSLTNELAHGYTSAQATFMVKRADPSKHKHVVDYVLAHPQLTRGRVIAKLVVLAERIWKPSKTWTLSRDPLLPTGQSTLLSLFLFESIQTGIIGCVKPRIPLLRPLSIRVVFNLGGKNSISSNIGHSSLHFSFISTLSRKNPLAHYSHISRKQMTCHRTEYPLPQQ